MSKKKVAQLKNKKLPHPLSPVVEIKRPFARERFISGAGGLGGCLF
ncbi:MAG: hypothetical protein AB1757_14170 [Acidobacteriota bacterium]